MNIKHWIKTQVINFRLWWWSITKSEFRASQDYYEGFWWIEERKFYSREWRPTYEMFSSRGDALRWAHEKEYSFRR